MTILISQQAAPHILQQNCTHGCSLKITLNFLQYTAFVELQGTVGYVIRAKLNVSC